MPSSQALIVDLEITDEQPELLKALERLTPEQQAARVVELATQGLLEERAAESEQNSQEYGELRWTTRD